MAEFTSILNKTVKTVVKNPNKGVNLVSTAYKGDSLTRVDYLKSILADSKKIDTAKTGVVVTGTVAGVATTTEADAMPLGSLTKNLITGAVPGATERKLRYTEDEIKAATDELARYEAITKELTLNPTELLTEDNVIYAGATDVQRLLQVADNYANDSSTFDAAWTKNIIDVWTTRLEHEITDDVDLKWVTTGRDEWYKENLAEYNFSTLDGVEVNKSNGVWHFKKWWDEADEADLPTNKLDTFNLFRRYADEYALGRRIYASDTSLIFTKPGEDWSEFEALIRGFSMDIATGFGSPQELALMVTTAGTAKIYTTSNKAFQAKQAYDRASKGKRAIMGYGGTAIIGGATALTVEETRQALKGIDLDNSEVMVIIGGLFGISTHGIPKAFSMAKEFFMKLSKGEQKEVLGKVAKEVLEIQQETEKKVATTTTTTQKDTEKTYDELEQEIIDKGYKGLDDESMDVLGAPRLDRTGIAIGASRVNPSPLLRAYDLGIKPIYNLLSKIKASTNTLMKDGKVVVQQGPTADSIYKSKYVGTHNKLIAKLRNLIKTSKMKTNDFNIALDTAVKKQTALYRSKRVEIEVLSEFIRAQQTKLKASTDPKATFRLKTVISNYEKKLDTAKAREVEILKSGNDNIDKGVGEIQEYYKVYNTNIHSLDRRDLLKKQAGELEDVADPKKVEEITARHEQELIDLDDFYNERHLGYSPRYWNREAIARDPKYIDKLTRALLNSPYARALKQHNPEDYKKFISEIPDIVLNMRNKIRDTDMENNLRDISGARAGGQGDKVKGKSEISRRIDVDELEIQDLVQSDWTTVTQAYNHDLGHKLSVREALDIKNWDEFEELYMPGVKDSLARSNLSDEARTRAEDDVKAIVQEALGTRGLIKKDNFGQRARRVLVDSANAIFSPGFGLTTLLESGPVLTNAGRDMIHTLLPSFKQVLKEYNLLWKNKGFDENSMDSLRAMGIAGNIQNSLMANRLDDGTFYAFHKKASFDRRWAEGAKWTANKGYHLGGFHGITSYWKYVAASSFQVKLQRVGTRLANGGNPLSKSEEKYFGRLGMDTDTLLRISKMPMKDKDGHQNFNMTDWDDDLKEMTMDSMNRATNESVLEPSGYDTPRFMTGGGDVGAMSAIFMQYQRFPLAAYNMYIKNGMSDRDGKIMASAATSFVVGSIALFLKEESEVAMGTLKEHDRRYNLFSDVARIASDSWARLGVDVMNKTPALSMLPKYVSIGQAITRQEQLGPDGFLLDPRHTAMPVSLSTVGRIWEIGADAIEDGEVPYRFLNYTPIVARNPLSQGFIDYTVEQND